MTMTDGLQIGAELEKCDARLASLDAMLALVDPGQQEVVNFLNLRCEHWNDYKAGLLYMRDHNPNTKQWTDLRLQVFVTRM
jgi:hypothetical protein